MTTPQTITLPKSVGNKLLYVIYGIAFLSSLHVALSLYIESSFIEHVLGKLISSEPGKYIGIVFSSAYFVTLVMFLRIPNMLRKTGNFILTFLLITIEILVLLGITLYDIVPPYILIFLFIIHLVVVVLIQFNLDLFLEDHSNDTTTGTIRGIFLTASSVAFIIAPFVAGRMLTNGNFWILFFVSALLMIPALFLLYINFSTHKDPHYDALPILDTCKEIWHKKNIRHIMATSFLLNFFYSWMIIYIPIYLHSTLHIPLSTIIGIIMPIALLPFVLFQFILGKIADTKLGEKEILMTGFVILGISTSLLSFVTTSNIALWAGLLFITRIGASSIEIMSDTYFYKHVDSTDTHLMSFFRILRPLAWIIAPMLATAYFVFFDIRYLFLILGIIMLSGLYYSYVLQDTR